LSQDRNDEYSAAVPLRVRKNRVGGAEFIAFLNRITWLDFDKGSKGARKRFGDFDCFVDSE
jgi:hypothetical protein